MSLASIFARFDDLDRKIAAIATVGNATSVANATAGTVDKALVKRIEALEALFSQQPNLESIYTRLAVLESKVMPSELPQKVENMENVLSNFQTVVTGNASDIQLLSQKLEHLESVTFPHVVSRLENVEHKVSVADE